MVLDGVFSKHRELYLTNAWFKRAVDGVIPLIIEGFALMAQEQQEEFEKEHQRLTNMVSSGMMGDDTTP